MTLHLLECNVVNGQRVCAPLTDGTTVAYVVGFAVLCLLGGALLAWGLVKLHRYGKIRHIEVDPETHQATTNYVRPRGNEVTYKDPTATAGSRTVRLTNGARLVMDGKSTWLTHRRIGHNYAPPPDRLTIGTDPMLAYLAIDDPAGNAHANARKGAQEALRSQITEDKWTKIAPYLAVGVVISVLIAGASLYFIVKVATGANT